MGMFKGMPKIKLDYGEYDALYISDIHFIPEALKSGQNNQRSLLLFMKSLKKQGFKFQRMFIVGDGLENWFVSSEHEFINNPDAYHDLFSALESISQQRFYIIGNHCTRSLNMKLPKLIERYLRKRGWQVLRGYRDDTVVVIHGHQAQYTMWQWRFFIPLAYIMYSILRLIPGGLKLYEYFVLSVIDFDKTKSHAEHLKYQTKLVNNSNRGHRWLISGHTHRPIHFKTLKAINTGDWSINQTFVTQKKSNFQLWEYDIEKGVRLISSIK